MEKRFEPRFEHCIEDNKTHNFLCDDRITVCKILNEQNEKIKVLEESKNHFKQVAENVVNLLSKLNKELPNSQREELNYEKCVNDTISLIKDCLDREIELASRVDLLESEKANLFRTLEETTDELKQQLSDEEKSHDFCIEECEKLRKQIKFESEARERFEQSQNSKAIEVLEKVKAFCERYKVSYDNYSIVILEEIGEIRFLETLYDYIRIEIAKLGDRIQYSKLKGERK